jgi:GNAT superfamily N-acetyltransferase
MEIRARRERDLGDLATIAARVHDLDNYPIFLPGGDYTGFITRPTSLAAWVAVRGRQLVGHVALNDTTSNPVMQLVDDDRPAHPPAYVARLLVDPGSRREGVGRRLLEHARREALSSGRVPYLDVVDIPTAASVIALYRHDGWVEVGRVRFELAGEEIDELVFRGPSSPE